IALTVLSFVIGVFVTFWTHRILSPISALENRVAAVARGDLSTRLEPRTDDELGRLVDEFEKMVDAISARDAALREVHEEQLRTRARLTQSERLAAIGRMAAHVTHEVRNPLSSIGLNVELLEEDLGEANEETRALLVAIQREIDRLTEITNEYLRLARIPSPNLEVDDVGTLLESLVDFVGGEMAEGKVALEFDVAPNLPKIAMDESQLRQVFLNLLRNAREAMPEGGRALLRARERDGGVEVEVVDNGSGISEGDRERIFELFYTTKENGTGLGLPLTQQIVVAHGGRIECTEAEGSGTRFCLWFPPH
ncbi:MAG: HAMP domain-containing protein, partial [Myxococcales bacterium]|nr:HAMP domain-containing protein [Myxococcales bacterium]